MKPTRSAKRTETRRRSAVGSAVLGWRAAMSAGARGAPHSPQKSSPGSLVAPQAGQAALSGLPHFAQNLRPSRFSTLQLGQSIRPQRAYCGGLHLQTRPANTRGGCAMGTPLLAEELWELLEPLLPARRRRYRYPVRKRIDDRKVRFWGRTDRAEPGRSAQAGQQTPPDHRRERHPARLPSHRRQPQRRHATARARRGDPTADCGSDTSAAPTSTKRSCTSLAASSACEPSEAHSVRGSKVHAHTSARDARPRPPTSSLSRQSARVGHETVAKMRRFFQRDRGVS